MVEDPLEEGNLGADRGEELGVEGAQRIDDALHFLLGDQHKFGVLLTHDTPHAKRGEREREVNNSPAACGMLLLRQRGSAPARKRREFCLG